MTVRKKEKLRRFTRIGLRPFLVIASACALVVSASAFQAASGATGRQCTNFSLQVALTPGGATNQTVAGELCTPTTWAPGDHQIDIATPGGSYNRAYFDLPVSGYSYVDKTLAAGRAILAYDKISTGQSSRPSSLVVTAQAHAYVLHQIIQNVRTSLGYTQVNVIGHSIGSVAVMDLAGTYPHDANRVVITAAIHLPNLGFGLLDIPTSAYPALLDPKFAGQISDPGYLTTIPGARKTLFYLDDADPAVLAADEQTKDVMSATELTTTEAILNILPGLNVTNSITAPVLIVMGQEDALFCNPLFPCSDQTALFNNEKPYYSNASSLTVNSIPNTAHDLATAPTKDESFSVINSWINSH